MCGKDINGGDYENAYYEDNSERQPTPITGRIYRQLQPQVFYNEKQKEEFWKNFQHPGDR